ncbi:MAG: HAD family phosphatase [Lachnospiraceae bacterium]|nr:HAD family phosphatase [Lachnospiraceae bacterium]
MNKCKGNIFDLDGTLLDSMGLWQQIDVKFLTKRGLEVSADYQRMITPMGFFDAAVYTIERFALYETPDELIQEWIDMAYEAYSQMLLLKPYAYDYVKKLHQTGRKLAIATSSERYLVMSSLERTRLLPMLDTVVTVKDVNRGKGFPDIYEKAAKDLGLEPEKCAVYEDIIEGIRGAQAGNFMSVGVYDSQYKGSYEIMKQESDIYIYSFKELL